MRDDKNVVRWAGLLAKKSLRSGMVRRTLLLPNCLTRDSISVIT